MYTNVTDNFKDLMLSGSGMITSKLVFDDFELSGDDIYNITYKAGSSDGKSIAPGTVYIPELQAEILSTDKYLRNKEMIWYVGLSEDGVNFEYAKVGTVWVKTVEKNTDTIKFTAYSKMYNLNKSYTSDLAYPASESQVLYEISKKTGITIDTSGLILSNTIKQKPVGYTYRQILGEIAGLHGCFVVPNRDDSKLMFKWYEDNNLNIGDGYDEPQLEDMDVNIGSLACNNITYFKSGYVMQWSCMYMTRNVLEGLLDKLSLTYRVGSFNLLSGNILIDPWDIVTLSYNGETYKMPAGILEHKYDGGLSTSIQTPGDTDGSSTSSSPNPNAQAMERLVTQLIEAQNIIAEKADIIQLEAVKAEINNLIADKASIQQLEAMQAVINYLSANKAEITDLDVIRADIIELNANKANISELEVAVGNISNLSSVVANITTILSGQIGTGTLHAINITAENTTISEAAIKELIAGRITVNDLVAGKISTDKFEISSDDGGLSFSGATAQWKDKNGVVRVQIGKDAQGDFTFTLFDASGKGVLIDSSGIHENAVPDGLIVDSMVSDNANIAGKKLDIESVINSINEDGSTSLKSSKIIIDATGQTLDIAFKSIETKTSDLEETITSQGESISVIQGQIKQKIWKSDITTALEDTEEKITILRDQYNTVSDTLSSHAQEIADVQTKVESKADGSTVSAIESRVAAFEQNLDGFKLTVSRNFAEIDDWLESAESSITQLADNIELKVEKNGVISSINQSPEKITIDAKRVDINGAVEFINNGYSTKINGDAIETGTITADKINVDSLQAISAKIGGFTIGDTYLANGTNTLGELGPEEMIENISLSIPSGGTTVSKTITMSNKAAFPDYPIRFYDADTNTLLGVINTAESLQTFITPSGANYGMSLQAVYTGAISGVVIYASRDVAITLNLRVVWYNRINSKGSVYLGLDGISCGETFSVNSDGNLKAVSGNIAGFDIDDNAIMFKGMAAGMPHYAFLNSNMITRETSTAYYSVLLGVDTDGYVEPDARKSTPALYISHNGWLVSTYNHNMDDVLEIYDAAIHMAKNRYIYCDNKRVLGMINDNRLKVNYDAPYSTDIHAGTSSGAVNFYINGSRKAYVDSSGVSNTSDERLKSNIEDMDDKYVQIADKLEPKTFNYKDDDISQTNMGFVAQDLEAIISELGIDSANFAPLRKDDEGFMGINYIQLIPILWAKVQQLSEEIKNLKSNMEGENNGN